MALLMALEKAILKLKMKMKKDLHERPFAHKKDRFCFDHVLNHMSIEIL